MLKDNVFYVVDFIVTKITLHYKIIAKIFTGACLQSRHKGSCMTLKVNAEVFTGPCLQSYQKY